MSPIARRITLCSLLFSAVTASAMQEPEVPAALRAPADEELFVEARAVGVQVYECTRQAAAPGYAWTFRAPEAALTDASGRDIGKHYAGPTWEAPDGSRVAAEVKARDAGPRASAIPWLLLSAKSIPASGTLAGTRSVQRVDTVGGIAPSSACNASNTAEIARVPYTATYYFYRARAAGGY